MKNNSLIVSEVFYSIQGEGITMGVPAVFIRLGGCNLLCDGEWRCDTIEVWKKGKSIEFENILPKECVNAILKGAHIIFTGGEPLLQQWAIFDFIQYLKARLVLDLIIEIETNGTILPCWSLRYTVNYWNCSPKLGNSGIDYEKRVNEIALDSIQNSGSKGQHETIFKFVISKKEDWLEIQDEYSFLPLNKIVLMPAGDTQEMLNITRPMVMELCKVTGCRYSDRLHIVAWNKKTGV